MRPEKQALVEEYIARLNASPFFIVIEYQGLDVEQFSELRGRLAEVGAEVHVVKNRIFRLAAANAGYPELELKGQLAIVTGEKEISATAKAIKSFAAEFDKPKFQFGFLGEERLDQEQLQQIADLPPLETLRAQLLATVMGPAAKLARVIQEPAASLARVIKARADKEGGA